ncbi:hypothetical protein Taro_021197 [Colocasia esculenta]|uniref:Uncharacterized protein n=1 Tax=Colocasia esculenta TaxID=4460 RepID=A0A843V4N6_COLES|nr:hypothetical protein [Colocasia esculenta]
MSGLLRGDRAKEISGNPNGSDTEGGEDVGIPQPLQPLPPAVELQKLILAHNNLEVLKEDLKNLTSLTVLNISHNKLSSLPAAIGELAMLKSLDVSHNSITSIPEEIGSATSLVKERSSEKREPLLARQRFSRLLRATGTGSPPPERIPSPTSTVICRGPVFREMSGVRVLREPPPRRASPSKANWGTLVPFLPLDSSPPAFNVGGEDM